MPRPAIHASSDNENRWIFYSSLVPGYTDKYGSSGMRERNRTLLRRIQKAKSAAERFPIEQLLIENNLPLAKYISERWRVRFRLSREQERDDFQTCCLTLIRFVRTMEGEALRPSFFMRRIYMAMYTALYAPAFVGKTLGNTHTFVPFNENDFPAVNEEPVKANMPLLLSITRQAYRRRGAEVLSLYVQGNEQKHVQPENLQDIGFALGLTTGRVQQIRQKTIEKMTDLVRYYINHKRLQREDFFLP